MSVRLDQTSQKKPRRLALPAPAAISARPFTPPPHAPQARLGEKQPLHPQKILTPSQYAFPVFVLCPPVYVDNAIKNNPTMKEAANAKPMDRNKFLAQWFNFYKVIAANALVYLIPPIKGYQDLTFVNQFVYLPHYDRRDTVILSNFTGEGRAGEETVAGALLKDLGYDVVKCPFKFESEPELKWLHDNLYIGGYGFRSDIRAHEWIEKTYGAKIIKLKETDPVLYHLDCSVFPIGRGNVLLAAEIMEPKTVKEIEKVSNVIWVSKSDAYAGICNSVQVDDCIYNASSLQFMSKSHPDYEETKKKDERLEKICRELGQELMWFEMSGCESSGAKLSCLTGTLNSGK